MKYINIYDPKIELTGEEVRELEEGWDIWNDESYAIHAAYILRAAILRNSKNREEEYGSETN